METFLLWFCWIVFILMLGFAILYVIFPNAVNGSLENVRRFSFLIMFGGALVYWSSNKDSIFENWKHYLIVFGVYLIIDIFFLLGSRVTEIGTNSKVEPYAESIKNKQTLLHALRNKTEDAFIVLDEMENYAYTTEGGYLSGIQDFLSRYARSQQLTIGIKAFNSSEDKSNFFAEFSKRDEIRIVEQLRVDGLYFTKDGQRAFRQLELLGKSYLLDIVMDEEGNGIFEKTDIFLLDILLITYNKSVVKA